MLDMSDVQRTSCVTSSCNMLHKSLMCEQGCVEETGLKNV